MKIAISIAIDDSVAAASPGRRLGGKCSDVEPKLESRPPIGGPRIRPRPKAMLMRAISRERFSSSVVSAMYACAVEMLAEAMPEKMRVAKSIATFEAKANVEKPRMLPKRLIIRTGRRPMRSESRPQIGEKRNCMNEKLPRIRPRVMPLAPY